MNTIEIDDLNLRNNKLIENKLEIKKAFSLLNRQLGYQTKE